MRLIITGDLRSIANAAWISTMDQSKAEQRTDDDVKRVTSFLAKNAHTSPFEAVTVTIVMRDFEYSNSMLEDCISGLKFGKYFKFGQKSGTGEVFLTSDLLNFFKVCRAMGEDSEVWKEFSKSSPDIAERLLMIPLKVGSELSMDQDADDQSENFEESNIEVDLVSVHSIKNMDSHSRITWRIKCPLSIGVQILRHRTGSFNMVSGRYKTIRQEFTTVSEDLIRIFERADLLTESKEMRSMAEETKSFYLSFMKKLAQLKRSDVISNEEYKRCREFVRFILPEGRMTELYVTFYKEDFDHFLKLRNSSHTQPEHIYIAQLMKKTYENYLELGKIYM
jgi:flavin-dependent thymidylate synthase